MPRSISFRFSMKYCRPEERLGLRRHAFLRPESGGLSIATRSKKRGGNLYGFMGNSPVNGYDYLGMLLSPSRRKEERSKGEDELFNPVIIDCPIEYEIYASAPA